MDDAAPAGESRLYFSVERRRLKATTSASVNPA
jgi:hypothetical protein